MPLLASLAACGGASAPRVAHLPAPGVTSAAGESGTPGSGAGGVGGSVDGALPPDPEDTDTAVGRPQFRLDDTDARRTALVNAYSQCLLDHGATRGGRTGAAAQPVAGGAGGVPYIQVADPVPAAAKAACAGKLPLMPPQVEAATNPHFHEQSLAYVACLKKHGEWVELLDDHDLDWTYVAGHPVPDDNGTIEQQCLMQAFGSGS